MRILYSILVKEFIQIFRNRVMLPFIFIAPVVQLVLLVFAANLDIKEIRFYVVDNDMSTTARNLTSEFRGSSFFTFAGSGFNMKEAEDQLMKGEADIIIHFPHGFGERLKSENKAQVQLIINAINATTAGLTMAYAEGIISNFNNNLITAWTGLPSMGASGFDITYSYWYNPELNYKIYMLPGIVVILVTIIGMFLAALNLVREKEMGTAEQINVTPIRKYHFIIGKLLPFWIIALFELAFGITIGVLFFRLPVLGNLFVLFGFAGVYLLAVLGIGLLLSTLADTQQQVMFLSFFFMLTFILMSGIFTPVESMPLLARKINVINPYAYFMKVIRMVLLKGSTFADISREFYSMVLFAVISLSLAIWRYRKVS